MLNMPKSTSGVIPCLDRWLHDIWTTAQKSSLVDSGASWVENVVERDEESWSFPTDNCKSPISTLVLKLSGTFTRNYHKSRVKNNLKFTRRLYSKNRSPLRNCISKYTQIQVNTKCSLYMKHCLLMKQCKTTTTITIYYSSVKSKFFVVAVYYEDCCSETLRDKKKISRRAKM